MTRLESLGELARVLLDSFRKPTFFALEPDGLDKIDALEEAEQRLEEYRSAQAGLSCHYEPFAWRKLDGEEISRRWTEADQKRWPMSTFAKRRIVKELCANGARGIPNPSQDAPLLADLRREGEAIDRLDGLLSGLKGWSAHATPTATAASLREIGQRARVVVGRLTVDPQGLVELRARTEPAP